MADTPQMPALPEPLGHVVDRYAFRVSPHGQDAEGREWMEFTDDPAEAGAFPVFTARGLRDHAQAVADGRVRALEAELAGLRAARIAYASEFPPNADGEPDVGSIHANIRELKQKAARYDWLRAQPNNTDAPRIDVVHWTAEDEASNCGEGLRMEALDAAIDARLAEIQPPQKADTP